MKTKLLAILSLVVLGLSGCTEQSAQMQALAAAAEKKATEATLLAEKLKLTNEQLASDNARLESELAEAREAGAAAAPSSSAPAHPKAEVTKDLELALFMKTREFKASLEQALEGYSDIRVSDAPSIQVAEFVSSPYSMPLGLIAVDPDGKRIFAEFEAKGDWDGNWTIPPVEEILASKQVGDPMVASTSGGASKETDPADSPASGGSEANPAVANNGSVAANTPKPPVGDPNGGQTAESGSQPPRTAPAQPRAQPSFLQGKQLQGSAKVDWSRAVE